MRHVSYFATISMLRIIQVTQDIGNIAGIPSISPRQSYTYGIPKNAAISFKTDADAIKPTNPSRKRMPFAFG